MKKAFLVTFETTTRVIADVSSNFNPQKNSKQLESIIKDARNNILDEPYNYLEEYNAEVKEDTECPYGQVEEDEFIEID